MSTPTAVANSSQNVAVTVYAQNTDASVRASFVNADCCAVTSGCMAVSSCQRRMAHGAQLDQVRGRGLASPEVNPIEGSWENPQGQGIGRETRQSNAVNRDAPAPTAHRANAKSQ